MLSAKLNKTLVEKILDRNHISYVQYELPVDYDDEVANLQLADVSLPQHKIYKTLVVTGKKTGPVVGVLPIDEHMSLKKIAKVSGNKKVNMLPLKELAATTGYEHGANTPVGIYETHHFPIYLSQMAENETQILVSSGKIGRSIGINPKELATFVNAPFVDITE